MNYPDYSKLSILLPDWDFEMEFIKLVMGSEIVDATFNYFQIERIAKEGGRNPWDLKNMIKLIFLASIDKIESSVQISKEAKSNILYSFLCGGIEPSDRSIREYRYIYNAIHQLILSFTLIA